MGVSAAWIGDLQVQGGGNGIGLTKWYDRAAPRRQYTKRPRNHGGIENTRYYDGRVFSLEGNIAVANPADLEGICDQVAGACGLGDDLIVLRFQRDGMTFVEQAEVVAITELNMPRDYSLGKHLIRWSIDFASPDPRRFADTATAASYDPTVGGVHEGVSFPLRFPLRFTGAGAATMSVTNQGNYETPPVFTITGPAIDPIVDDETHGKSIYTTGVTLGAADTLVIDVAAKKITLNGASRPDLYDSSQSSWLNLQPGVTSLRMRAEGMVAGQTDLAVTFRDARI